MKKVSFSYSVAGLDEELERLLSIFLRAALPPGVRDVTKVSLGEVSAQLTFTSPGLKGVLSANSQFSGKIISVEHANASTGSFDGESMCLPLQNTSELREFLAVFVKSSIDTQGGENSKLLMTKRAESLVSFLQARPSSSLFRVDLNGQVVGIIDQATGKYYFLTPHINVEQASVVPINEHFPVQNLDSMQNMQLNQYVWNNVVLLERPLLKVDPEQGISIEAWPHFQNLPSDLQRQITRILTILNVRPTSATRLAKKLGLSVDEVVLRLSALILAGFARPDAMTDASTSRMLTSPEQTSGQEVQVKIKEDENGLGSLLRSLKMKLGLAK